MSKILASKILGEGEDFIVLHGLFGMKDNWNKFARDLENKFRFHLLDIRNHGESFQSEEFNYTVMSQDLLEYMNFYKIEKAYFLGHSMGGKVLMEFVCKYPQKVIKPIIVDITPRYYLPHHGDIIKSMKNLDLESLENRKSAEDFLFNEIKDKPTVMFLLKNLQRKNEQFYWTVNLKSIENNLEEIGRKLEDNCVYNGEILFIKGEISDYIKETDIEIIRTHFPKYKIDNIENAGHIVHLENYRAFFNSVIKFLQI